MTYTTGSIFEHAFKPWKQGILVLFLFCIIIGICYLLNLINLVKYDNLDTWKYATSLVLFYIILNSMFCFSSKKKMLYYRDSIFTYVALLLILTMTSEWISGIPLSDAETYSWILLVFSIVYIVFITIINLSRKIVELAIKQDKKLTDEK